jgi:hypothetical protein
LIVALIPGSATVSLRTTSLFEKGGQAKGDLGRNRRREPKTAFSGFPPVHGADLKGQLRVVSDRTFFKPGTSPSGRQRK